MKKSLILILVLVLTFGVSRARAQFDESDSFDNCESFESAIPSYWKAVGGGQIALSGRRHKQGQSCLRWDWQSGSKISVTDPDLKNVSVKSNSGMHIWFYSENNIDDPIEFRFYDQSNTLRCRFKYQINFTGWRGLWVRFWDDIVVSGDQIALSRMEILAPENTNAGSVYFDIVEFAPSVSYKRSPAYQYAHPYPYTDNEEVRDEWASWIYEQRYPEATLPLPSTVSEEAKQTLETITQRFDNWLLGTDKYSTDTHMKARLKARNSYVASGVRRYGDLDIKIVDDRIYGPGLFPNKSTHSPKFGCDIGEKLCLQLALDYRLNGNQSSKEKLLLLFDYMHDQGWAAGSAMETTDHQKLRTAAWAYAVYLLQDELKQQAWINGQTKLDREMATLHWLSYFNIMFAPLTDRLEVSVDDFRSNTLMRLMYILMMDNNNPVKVQYMNHYTQWLNRNLRTFEGWTGGIKPDGMGYHHRGPYMNAYSNNGVHIISQVLYFLRHTAFDADTESKETVKKYLMNYRNITGFYDVPKSISGRISGLEKAVSMITPFAYLSQCMKEGEVDQELASTALAYWHPEDQPVSDLIKDASMTISYFNTPGEMEAILDVAHSTTELASNPKGLWIKPYAAMATFRSNNWFVSVKGTSAYVWDFESGKNENTYGRYDSYGQMETINNVLPYPSMVKSGHDYNNGWDWCRIPGTTSVNMQLSDLMSDQQRSFTTNTFVGGVEQNHQAGVWAMDYDDVHYGTGLSFKKSIFFFEPGMMVCLGSDIQSAQAAKTESTILQNVISSSGYTYHINGELVDQLDYSYTPVKASASILDSKGKGVFIPDDASLNISYAQRNSKTMRRKASSGEVLTAWFNHADTNEYEYVVLMETNQEELNRLANSPSYKVIQHNGDAHIVKHDALGQTGYALFSANKSTDDDFIQQTSLPVMVMVTDQVDKSKSLSICNPDFNRNKYDGIGDVRSFDDLFGPFEGQTVELRLKGAWVADDLPDNIRIKSSQGSSTVITVDTHDAETYDFILKPDTASAINNEDIEGAQAWPNPTSGMLYFSMSESASLFNLEGRCLLSADKVDSFNMNLLDDGLYILEQEKGTQKNRIKVLKVTSR
jgi:hypothetical protein